MENGESLPPSDGEWMGPIAATIGPSDPWWIVVRYSDCAGQRWQFVEPGNQRELAQRPRRIRNADW